MCERAAGRERAWLAFSRILAVALSSASSYLAAPPSSSMGRQRAEGAGVDTGVVTRGACPAPMGMWDGRRRAREGGAKEKEGGATAGLDGWKKKKKTC